MRPNSSRHTEDPLIPTEWVEKEVAVVGLGRTGVAVGEWLADRGVRVYASDADDRPELGAAAERLRAKSVAVDLGAHDLKRIGAAAAVVVSPGVPPTAAPLVVARQSGIPVVAELDLALRALAGTRSVVVTGTNGKTTTTALTAHLLQAGGIKAEAAGNIGRPLIELAAADLDWVVVEASSFQLHDAPNLAPSVGVLTNLAPDHLDRYDSLESYYADKKRLFQHGTDESVWILNGDDEAVESLAGDTPGERRRWSIRGRADAWWDRSTGDLMVGSAPLVERSHLPLLGDHNVENALAAILAAAAVGVECSEMPAALETFQPLAHRLEPVREVGRVLWINDSKATNVASTAVGLTAMDRPFVLLVGGREKGEDFRRLIPRLQDCRAVIAFGEAAERFRRDLGGAVNLRVASSLDDAVTLAQATAAGGEAVLLSPACASFDQFRDFEQRGDSFKQMVAEL